MCESNWWFYSRISNTMMQMTVRSGKHLRDRCRNVTTSMITYTHPWLGEHMDTRPRQSVIHNTQCATNLGDYAQWHTPYQQSHQVQHQHGRRSCLYMQFKTEMSKYCRTTPWFFIKIRNLKKLPPKKVQTVQNTCIHFKYYNYDHKERNNHRCQTCIHFTCIDVFLL